MTPKKALATLVRAAMSQNQLLVGPALHLQKTIIKELEAPQLHSSQLKAIKAENTDLTLRIAELEEELAEARKPRRRTRKKNDDTGTS